MKNSNRIIKLMFLALTITSLPFLRAETSVQEDPSVTEQNTQQPDLSVAEQVNDTLEKILRDVNKQFAQIDVVLQELAGVVANNRIQVKNKEAMKNEISALRDLINKVTTEKSVTVDPNDLKIFLNIGKALTDHLNKALADKFQELSPFNLDEQLQYRSRTDITFEELTNDVARNAKEVEILESQAKDAGLTWYNKAFRWTEEKKKGTSDHHWIGRYALIGVLATATWFFYYYWLDTAKKTIKIPWFGECNFRNLLGEPLVIASEKPQNLEDVKLLGHVNNWLDLSKLGKNSIGLALAGATGYFTYKELPELKKWGSDQASKLYAFLRGRTLATKTMVNGEKEPRFTFKDMVGYDYLKNELMVYVKYLEDPERFDMRKLTPPAGCLIVGPPGTGKSFGAECLAGEIQAMLKRNNRKDKLKFFSYNSKWIREFGISGVLGWARENAPCILLVDEIDMLPLQRENKDPLLSEFLNEMSGYLSKESKEQVIVIGITNKPENLEKALRRSGRFEKTIYVGYPTTQERKAFIIKKLASLSINPDLFNIDKIAKETEGKSLEDINVIISNALLKANIKGQILTQALFEESFDETVRRITHIQKELSADEKKLITVHQAGHALSHLLIDSNNKLAKVTIRPVIPDIKEENVWDKYWKDAPKLIEYGKMFTYHISDRLSMDTQAEKVAQAKQLLAGHASEKVFFGSSGYSYHREDKQIAFEIIKSMVFEGVRPEDYSKAQYSKLLDTTHAIVNQLEAEVIELFEKNKDKLLALVDALEQKQTLTEREVEEILNITAPLSPAAQLAADKTDIKQAEHQLINGEVTEKAGTTKSKETEDNTSKVPTPAVVDAGKSAMADKRTVVMPAAAVA